MVGGNSLTNIVNSEITADVFKTQLSNAAQKSLSRIKAAAGKAFGAITTAYSFATEFASHYSTMSYDKIAFQLLDQIQFAPESSDIYEVTRWMDATYSFIAMYDYYFFGSYWRITNVASPGMVGSTFDASDPYWNVDKKLLDSKNLQQMHLR